MTEAVEVRIPLRVAVVDDDPHVHESLPGRFAQQPGQFIIVGSVRSLAEVRRLDLSQVDVVIADLYLAGSPKTTKPTWNYIGDLIDRGAKVLVYSSSDDDEDIFEATQQFQVGFLHKYASHEEFCDMVRLVASGKWHQAVDHRWAMSIRSVLEHRTAALVLTDRQREVLELLSQGHGRKDIAEILSITTDTVRGHFRGLRDQLCPGEPVRGPKLVEAARRRRWLTLEGFLPEWLRPGRRRAGP